MLELMLTATDCKPVYALVCSCLGWLVRTGIRTGGSSAQGQSPVKPAGSALQTATSSIREVKRSNARSSNVRVVTSLIGAAWAERVFRSVHSAPLQTAVAVTLLPCWSELLRSPADDLLAMRAAQSPSNIAALAAAAQHTRLHALFSARTGCSVFGE